MLKFSLGLKSYVGTKGSIFEILRVLPRLNTWPCLGLKPKKGILTQLLRFLLFVVFIFLTEFFVFYLILTHPRTPEKADLIAVFAGTDSRIEKGYKLANSCLARFLTISPYNAEQIETTNEKFKKKTCYQILIENRAETTFQNALLVGNLIIKKNLNSVLLVTNSYHMPRSYLLSRLQLLGKGIEIIPAPVGEKAFSKSPLDWTVSQKKRVYNEMMELWGSLAEMVWYRWSKHLPEKNLKPNRVISFIKDILLFDV